MCTVDERRIMLEALIWAAVLTGQAKRVLPMAVAGPIGLWAAVAYLRARLRARTKVTIRAGQFVLTIARLPNKR
jgi:hypothetical protein